MPHTFKMALKHQKIHDLLKTFPACSRLRIFTSEFCLEVASKNLLQTTYTIELSVILTGPMSYHMD